MGADALGSARIRFARLGDADGLARVNVAGWRTGYADFIPADFLAGLEVGYRADRWRQRLQELSPSVAPTWVAVDREDLVLAFAHTGPPRDDDVHAADVGELYGLYVAPEAWRRGIGTALMRVVDDFWAPTTVRDLVLWVFEANAGARAFYESLGWRPDGSRKTVEFGGIDAVEIRYRRSLR